jgi:hypothetical protein
LYYCLPPKISSDDAGTGIFLPQWAIKEISQLIGIKTSQFDVVSFKRTTDVHTRDDAESGERKDGWQWRIQRLWAFNEIFRFHRVPAAINKTWPPRKTK